MTNGNEIKKSGDPCARSSFMDPLDMPVFERNLEKEGFLYF